MKTVVIPFSGFYGTCHEAAIDCAVEQMLSDDSGTVYEGLMNRTGDVNYGPAFQCYAQAYAEAFLAQFELMGAFEALESPREYNFTTDRIFCLVEEADLARMLDETPPLTLQRHAAESFTSRSGFCSFYSPDTAEWGPLDEWDHNQLGCLLAAYVEHYQGEPFGQETEFDLLESWRCNGGEDDALCACEGMARLAKVAAYLRDRAARPRKRKSART